RARRSFDDYAASQGITLVREAEADGGILRFSETLLARAVGASSSRLVLALLMEQHAYNPKEAMRLLGDASDALLHNRDLLQSAIDHMRQGIAVFDRKLDLICWNRQFRSLLPLPASKGRVGVPLNELLLEIIEDTDIDPARRQAGAAARLQWLTRDMKPYQERLKSSGLVLDVRSSAMPDGGVVVTFADITETVEAGLALKRANETLERRVEERTAELTALNNQLKLAKKEAESANIGKTRFIAAASHDILQPLNAARLFAASLVEKSAGGSDEKLARNIDNSLEAVEEILNALLEISKLDAGAFKPEITTFSIRELFDPLAMELRPLALQKGLKLVAMPCRYQITSDRQLLRRLIQNLLSNAIKYTASGKVLIGCRRDGAHVRIEVMDTGPGIAANKQDLIFREFTRLDNTARDTTGLGLGLSIVRRIARVLGHELSLVSKPGVGTRFTVKVPLSVSAAKPVSTIRKARTPAGSLGNPRILVVDNDSSILDAMTELLSRWGCEVFCAGSVKAGLDLLARHGRDADLLLADFHLGDGDGLELIARMRKACGFDIPAILITADRTKALQARAAGQEVGYLTKPVKPAALRTAIAHRLVRPQAAE
ncbi:MAG TPA: response regulator, partial [Rhizobiales bacterium]|nr:response regulator [Hyphomicrobiales bacterium]